MLNSPYYGRSMGIDPGFGSSEFAIVISQGRNGKIEVLYADSLGERPRPEDCIDLVVKLRQQMGVQNIFIDASAAGFVTSLKYRLGDNDYNSYEYKVKASQTKIQSNIIDRLEHPLAYGKRYAIKPVNFATMHRELLSHDLQIISKHRIRIHPSFDKLTVALRTAFLKPNGTLDKEQTSYDDVLDAWSLSNLNYFFKESQALSG
jgi:hypothetical protein